MIVVDTGSSAFVVVGGTHACLKKNVAAVWLKVIDVVFMYWDLAQVDVFFVDWETVRPTEEKDSRKHHQKKKKRGDEQINTARCHQPPPTPTTTNTNNQHHEHHQHLNCLIYL